MKKIILPLIGMLTLSLASCNNDQTSNTTSSTTTTTTTNTTTTTTTTSQVDENSIKQAILESLNKDEIVFSGSLKILQKDSTGIVTANVTHQIDCLISSDHYFNKETGDLTYYVTSLYKDKDGETVQKSVDPKTLEVSETKVGANNKAYVFDEYLKNPIKDLTKDNIELDVANKKATINLEVNSEVARQLGFLLTYYTNIYLDTVEISYSINNDVLEITNILLSNKKALEQNKKEDQISLDIKFSSRQDLQIFEAGEDLTSDKSAELEDLFKKLSEGNYTANFTQTMQMGGVAEIVQTENELLQVNEDGIFTISNDDPSQVYGYLTKTPTTLSEVSPSETEEGKLQETQVIEGSYKDYVMPFSYDSSLFYFDEDTSTFNLPAGMGLYGQDFNVLRPESFYYRPMVVDDGSFSITFNDDDTYTFNYSETFVFQSVSVQLLNTIVVSDVGSTTLKYSFDDVILLPSATSWDDVTNAVDILNDFDLYNVLPFMSVDGATWKATKSQFASAPYFNLVFDDASVADKVLEDYQNLLKEKGWNSTDNRRFTYQLEDCIANIDVFLSTNKSQMTITFVDPTYPSTNTELDTYLKEEFNDSTYNYTLDMELVEVSTPLDANGNLDLSKQVKTTLMTGKQVYTNDAALINYETLKWGEFKELYVNYDEHNVQFVYNPDTSIYEPAGLGTYFHYDSMLMPLEKAFANTSHGNTKVEGTDNQFITTAPDTLRSIATSAFYSLPEFNYKNGEALITLDQDNKAFTIDMTLNKEILSDENGNKSEHYFVYHLKVSNIGTTTLDYESLIPEDFDFWTWAESF